MMEYSPRIRVVASSYTYRRCPHIDSQLFGFVDDFRYELCSAWSTTDDGHLLTSEVVVVIPMCRMPRDTFEVFAARSVAPFGPVERSDTLADDISNPGFSLAGFFVCNSDVPYHVVFIPLTPLDEALELCTLVETILQRKFRVVCFNL